MGGAREQRNCRDRFLHDSTRFDLQRMRREIDERVIRNQIESQHRKVQAPGDHLGANEPGGRDGEPEPAREENPVRVPWDCRAVAEGEWIREGGFVHRRGEEVQVRRR